MTRALVLSGGGPVGIGWETGVLAGLISKGVDIAAADFILGTSAGSAVGAQLALGRDLTARLDAYRQARADGSAAAPARGRAAPPPDRMRKLMEVMAQAGGATPEERRKAIGTFALEAETPAEESFVAGFAYLQSEEWPARYACTAVDAGSGEFVVWSRENPAPLDRAVASSCAVPGIFPPITINGRRYIDGGMRSGSNSDLAKGHDKVLLVTLMSPARAAANPNDPRTARARERIERERAVLAESGAELEMIGPDESAAAAIGTNLMDGSRAPDAADEGFRQGEELAPAIGEFWS